MLALLRTVAGSLRHASCNVPRGIMAISNLPYVSAASRSSAPETLDA